MKKTDKETEAALRLILTESCEIFLKKHEGFMWLTHFINYKNFPSSFYIICVFDTNEKLLNANNAALITTIRNKLNSIGINIKNIHRYVIFDTEEKCTKENNGNWKERLSQLNQQSNL